MNKSKIDYRWFFSCICLGITFWDCGSGSDSASREANTVIEFKALVRVGSAVEVVR